MPLSNRQRRFLAEASARGAGSVVAATAVETFLQRIVQYGIEGRALSSVQVGDLFPANVSERLADPRPEARADDLDPTTRPSFSDHPQGEEGEELVEDRIKSNSPYLTGRLRRSLRVNYTGGIFIITGVSYLEYVERYYHWIADWFRVLRGEILALGLNPQYSIEPNETHPSISRNAYARAFNRREAAVDRGDISFYGVSGQRLAGQNWRRE